MTTGKVRAVFELAIEFEADTIDIDDLKNNHNIAVIREELDDQTEGEKISGFIEGNVITGPVLTLKNYEIVGESSRTRFLERAEVGKGIQFGTMKATWYPNWIEIVDEDNEILARINDVHLNRRLKNSR